MRIATSKNTKKDISLEKKNAVGMNLRASIATPSCYRIPLLGEGKYKAVSTVAGDF